MQMAKLQTENVLIYRTHIHTLTSSAGVWALKPAVQRPRISQQQKNVSFPVRQQDKNNCRDKNRSPSCLHYVLKHTNVSSRASFAQRKPNLRPKAWSCVDRSSLYLLLRSLSCSLSHFFSAASLSPLLLVYMVWMVSVPVFQLRKGWSLHWVWRWIPS